MNAEEKVCSNMLQSFFFCNFVSQVNVWVLRPVQQVELYWDRSSALSLV